MQAPTPQAAASAAAEVPWDAWVARARDGDRPAFEALYRQTNAAVTRRVSHLVGPAGPVADLVQDVYVRAYRNLHRYRADAPFTHWVQRIATNVARDHHRRRRRQLWRLWARPETEAAVHDPAAGAETDLAHLQAVHRALDRLSSKLREAVILFEFEGLQLSEIADVQDVSPNTAASRVRRGKQKLKRHLRGLGFAPLQSMPALEGDAP